MSVALRNVVQIIFIDDGKVLLAKRSLAIPLGGLWGFPSGRIEHGEDPSTAAQRESIEEVGVNPTTFEHHFELLGDGGAVHYFFCCSRWQGELHNAEPHLCDEVHWFDIVAMPENCTPITYQAMRCLLNSEQLNSQGM